MDNRINIKYKPLSLPYLITEDMGYCCPYMFFSLYRRPAVIATRFGVSTWTVRFWRAKWKAGELQCCGKVACMKSRLPSLRKRS